MARNSGLLFRMENMDAAAAGGDADESLAINADATQAVEEVESASGDVTEVDTGIENAETAQTELGEVTELVQEAVDDGDGLSPREAAHVEARLEHIASLLGTTAADMGLTFRRESFGGKSSRLAATKMRLEGMKEWGKTIWEAIKKGWQWLQDAVVNLIGKIMGSLTAVEKRLKDLQGRINSIEGTGFKNEKVKTSAKAFSIANTTNLSTIEKVLESADGLLPALSGLAILSNVTNIKSLAEEISNNVNSVNGADGKPIGAGKSNFYGALEGPLGKVGTPLPSGAETGTEGYGRLINGQTVLLIPTKISAGGTEILGVKLEVSSADEKFAEDYAAFSKEELSKICKRALESVAEFKEFDKIKNSVLTLTKANEAWCDAQTKAGNQAVDKAEGSKKTDGKNMVEKLAVSMKMASAITRTAISKFPSVCFNTVSAAADLIDAGVSNFKEKETAKK